MKIYQVLDIGDHDILDAMYGILRQGDDIAWRLLDIEMDIDDAIAAFEGVITGIMPR